MRRIAFFAILLVIGITGVLAQRPSDVIPRDSQVRYGKLENGLTYYLRHNDKPEQRADFYIVQRVGSIQEEENQRGLAHFLEHMAFHDTKNFPHNSLISYLEKNGVKFGSNLNASTSVDQTIYNINEVPTTDKNLLDSCLLILHDWSGFISLKDKDIETERKVIHEEWRTRSDAQSRMFEAILPQAYPKGCRYAERFPIGLMSVVDSFKYNELRDYYHKWYRPDLQCIVVVGDIDINVVERRIKEMWSDVPVRKNVAPRIYYSVPDNIRPIIAISSDKEASSNGLQLLFNRNDTVREARSTYNALAETFYRNLMSTILNNRFDITASLPNSPYINATALDGDFLLSGTKKSFGVGAGYKTGAWREALKALVSELHEIRQYGFTKGEVERAKSILKGKLDNEFANKASLKNSFYVAQCVDNFLNETPMPDIETRAKFLKMLLDNVTVNILNQKFNAYVTDKNQVIIMMGQDSNDFPMPNKGQVLDEYRSAWMSPVVKREDTLYSTSLLSDSIKIKGSKVVSKQYNKGLGSTTYQLKNGATVILKRTTFKNNSIMFRAYSPGGNSLFSEKEQATFGSLNSIAGLGGLGSLSAIDLTKLLAGKNVKLQFSVNTTDESLYGSSSPADFETMLQMIYLCFQGGREDDKAFEAWKQQVRPAMNSRDMGADTRFQDSVNVMLYGNHPRYRQFKAAYLDSVDYRRGLQMFHERFSNAADFTFVFVGNVDSSTFIPFVEKYIGSLPSLKDKKETFRPVLPYRANGYKRCRFSMPMQTPKAYILLSYGGRMPYNLRNRMRMSLLRQILEMVYTTTLRGEQGGTYGAIVREDISPLLPKNEYTLSVNFETKKELIDKMIAITKKGLADIAANGPSNEMFEKAKAYMQKRHNSLLNENAYWMEVLMNNVIYGTDDYSPYDNCLQSITKTDIQSVAKTVMQSPSVVEAVLSNE